MSSRPTIDQGSVGVLITCVVSAASVLLVLTWRGAWSAATDTPVAFAIFLVLTVALMLMAVDVYGRGSISVAGVGLLAVGFTFGVGAAMVAGILAAVVHALRRRSRPHRALFNAATFALAAAAGAAAYHAFGDHHSTAATLGPALAAGALFWLVNIGLLTIAMGLSEEASFLEVWRERLRWLTIHYLAFGPLALASTIAYDRVGLTGLVAFAVPPGLLVLSVRQYLERTREAVEEVRRANEELRQAVDELAVRNDDLRELFEFAGGLAAQAHDRHALAAYVEAAVERATGARAQLAIGPGSADGAALVAGGRRVGDLVVQ